MMRLGRRATLLATFSLLTSAATAYAECAWVMWTTYRTNRTEHVIERAFQSQRDCEGAVANEVQRHVRAWRGAYETVTVSPVDPAVVIARGLPDSPRKLAEGETLMVRVSCWPLGLEPKGQLGARGASSPRHQPRGDGRESVLCR